MTRPRRTTMVTVQRRRDGQDAAGQPLEVWDDVRDEWAHIEAVSGREYFNASGERAIVTHRVFMYSGSGARARDRIMVGDRLFNITSVVFADSRETDLILLCVEVV